MTSIGHERAEFDQPALRNSPWYAIRVREKFRTATEEALTVQSVPFFSPVTTELRQWSDRIKRIAVPLFPGYLFGSFHPEEQLPILRTIGVIDIVRSGKHLAAVSPTELEDIHRALQSGSPIAPHPYLEHGQRVRVIQGPLRDVEGILAEVKSHLALVLSVTMMNRSVAVQIDRTHVEPV